MKTIRKNFLLLAFAAGALFFIGNNVFADDPGESEEPIDIPGPTITCSQFPSYGARCWKMEHQGWGIYRCEFTGYQNHFCV